MSSQPWVPHSLAEAFFSEMGRGWKRWRLAGGHRELCSVTSIHHLSCIYSPYLSSPDPSYHPSIICVYHPPSTINPPVHACIHPSSIH